MKDETMAKSKKNWSHKILKFKLCSSSMVSINGIKNCRDPCTFKKYAFVQEVSFTVAHKKKSRNNLQVNYSLLKAAFEKAIILINKMYRNFLTR